MNAREDRPPLDSALLNTSVDLLMEQTDEPEKALAARFPEHREQIPEAIDRARRYMARVRPTRVLGDFEVGELLGRGSMGRVYRARQRSLGGREVALKVLPLELAAEDPRFVERFRREAELAAKLNHPNVAEVYGSGEHEGQLYFAMRLVEGRTLADVISGLAERRLRGHDATGSADYARRVVLVVRELADALAAIHALGLVHRDVKPSNVVMEGARRDDERALEGRPILLDFGLLRPAEGSDTTLTRGLGTPAYASPEVLLGEQLDSGADVFCLGALLHDLLAVTRPGERCQAAAGLDDVRGLNRGVDARLGAIVRMATDNRRATRYPDGAAFRDELDRYLRGEPLRALPTFPLARARLWVRREPARALRIGAAVVLLTPLLVGLGWFGGAARGTYALAARARAHVAGGDLHAARREYLELEEAPLVRVLPGLGDDLDEAAAFKERFGALLDQLTGANPSDLRLGHAELQQRMLTPGEDDDAWGGRLLSFLRLELGDSIPVERRVAAAESLTAWFLVHPLPAGWSEMEAPSISDIREDTPVSKAILKGLDERLRAVATTSIGEDHDHSELQQFAIGVLANMPSADALQVMTACLALGDQSLQHQVLTAGAQICWLAWREGNALTLTPEAIGAWVAEIYRQEPGKQAIWPVSLAALIDLESSGVVLQATPWPLDEHPRKHIHAFRQILEAHRRGTSIPSISVAPIFGDEDFDEISSKKFWEHHFDPASTEYLYENIWVREHVEVYPDSLRRLSTRPTWHAGLDFQDGQPVLHGDDAVRVSWKGASIQPDSDYQFLQLGAIGSTELRFAFHVPEHLRGHGVAVTIVHTRAERGYLPDRGRAWFQVALEDGTIVQEGAGSIFSGIWTFRLANRVVMARPEVELRIRLVAGNTTYRVLWIDVSPMPPLVPGTGPSSSPTWHGPALYVPPQPSTPPEGLPASVPGAATGPQDPGGAPSDGGR